ncbi:MAG TPA: lactate utilization protein C [Blastocatellia bacterium]|nr:lactate utilization protein C [Blastocatellia bacterium]
MSVGDSREEILATIRAAVGTSARRDRLSAPEFNLRNSVEETRDELAGRFQSEMTRVGGRFHRATNAESVCAYIEQVAEAEGAKTIICSTARLADEFGIANRLAAKRIAFITDPTESDILTNAARAQIGVTGVDYALAETGSLVLLARPGQPRSVSLLPPVHIALIRPEQIIRGFDELFELLRADFEATGVKSAVTFITGPSRTADIELTLVVGVHGPQQLHAVLVDGQ